MHRLRQWREIEHTISIGLEFGTLRFHRAMSLTLFVLANLIHRRNCSYDRTLSAIGGRNGSGSVLPDCAGSVGRSAPQTSCIVNIPGDATQLPSIRRALKRSIRRDTFRPADCQQEDTLHQSLDIVDDAAIQRQQMADRNAYCFCGQLKL